MEKAQTIYMRTQRGHAELKLRHSELGPVVNGLLMLVNGQRTVGELVSVAVKLGAPPDSISGLETGGYIEPAPVRLPTGQTMPAPLTDAAPLLASRPAHDAWSDNDRRAFLYQMLIDAAKKHLGLTGFLYHLKVEKAVTLQELRDLIAPLGEAITRSKGQRTAHDFLQKVEGV